jgi:HEAT repeat protein
MVAFVQCVDNGSEIIPAKTAELFWVEDLLASEGATRLGQPKSASEGSERDREWKTIVPSRGGEVLSVDKERIKVRMDDGRLQSYQRRALNVYVTKGQRFSGRSEFIAGAPKRKALFSDIVGRRWDPRDIGNADAVDRYVQAKSLSVVGRPADIPLLKKLTADPDPRVALEAAGSLAKLGRRDGMEFLKEALQKPAEPYLPMEVVFLLSELGSSSIRQEAVELLDCIARDPAFAGNEVRQAAIWGLGRAGLHAYDRLLDFLDVEDEDERLHALVGFGPVLPEGTIRTLVGILGSGASVTKKSAVVHALSKLRPIEIAVRELEALALNGGATACAWAKAALGSLTDGATKQFLKDTELAKQLVPIQLMSPSRNWTKSDKIQESITSLMKQAALLR